MIRVIFVSSTLLCGACGATGSGTGRDDAAVPDKKARNEPQRDQPTADETVAKRLQQRDKRDEPVAKEAEVPAQRDTIDVKTRYFGTVSVADGAVAIMDGGTHGNAGHTIVAAPDGAATWARRIDSMRPDGVAGKGDFELSADEHERLRVWADDVWDYAGPDSTEMFPPVEKGAPRWVWAIVVRRGDEVRVLQGGSIAPLRGGLPDAAQQLLEWVGDRVDALSEAPSR